MNQILVELVRWSTPWYWYLVGLVFFLSVLLGVSPLFSLKDATTREQTLFYLRRINALCGMFCFFLFPLLVAMIGNIVIYQKTDYINFLQLVFFQGAQRHWPVIVFSLSAALLLKLLLYRFLMPYWSAWLNYRRIQLRKEGVSDIQMEEKRLKPMIYNPQRYYKNGCIFLGLGEDSKPTRVPIAEWKMENQKVIGPTQTGKGVLIGLQLDQAIRYGMTVVFIDPKPDKHAYAIMQQACKQTGRRLVSFDINGVIPGRWEPFRTGTDREVKTRLYTALGLLETGKESDFYKIKERRDIDHVFPKWDRRIYTLHKALSGINKPPERALNLISEMSNLRSINPPPKRGIDIDRALTESAVVYIRASITDPLILQTAKVFIQCVLQSTMRLYSEGKRRSHLFLVIDEVRFMASNLLANTLATITGTDAHLCVTYQSLQDLRNIDDVTVDKDSVDKSINVNCKSSIYYQAVDFETAQYASEQTGTKQITRYRYNIKQNVLGGEIYEDSSMITHEDKPYIDPNTFLMLPERVAVHMRPNKLAKLLYPHWVNVDIKPQQAASQPVAEKQKIDRRGNNKSHKQNTTGRVPATENGVLNIDDVIEYSDQ